MHSRRKLMQLLGLAPIMATSASKELASLTQSSAVQTAIAALSVGAGNAEGPGYPGQGAFGNVLARQLQFWRSLAADESYAGRATRLEGLDPDIAALRSTSRSYRVAKQLQRDANDAEFLARAERMTWGEPVQ